MPLTDPDLRRPRTGYRFTVQAKRARSAFKFWTLDNKDRVRQEFPALGTVQRNEKLRELWAAARDTLASRKCAPALAWPRPAAAPAPPVDSGPLRHSL